jgi:glucose 1-dehydrogenase
MLCRDLAIELAPLGITINNIAPGAIETPINSKLLSSPDH